MSDISYRLGKKSAEAAETLLLIALTGGAGEGATDDAISSGVEDGEVGDAIRGSGEKKS